MENWQWLWSWQWSKTRTFLQLLTIYTSHRTTARNIYNNNSITSVKSRTIEFKWPKIIGYADDVTIITDNTITSF